MKRILSLMALAAVAASAFSGTYYFDETSFVGAIKPDFYLEDFSGYTYGNPLNGTQVTASFGPVNGYSYDAGAPNGLWSNDGALSTNVAGDLLTITFTGKEVTAIGGIMTPTDINGAMMAGVVTVLLSDGGTWTTTYTQTTPVFVGYTSDVAITSLTIDALDTPAVSWPQLDHFYTGQVNPVPEPATIAALGLGAAALIRRRRR